MELYINLSHLGTGSDPDDGPRAAGRRRMIAIPSRLSRPPTDMPPGFPFGPGIVAFVSYLHGCQMVG
jgi:hypothetical protein